MPLELEKEQLTDFLMEIKAGRRIITVKDKILVIQVPSIQVMNEGSIVFSKILKSLLEAGTPSRAQSQQLLRNQIQSMGTDADILLKRDKVLQQIQEAIAESGGEQIVSAAKSVTDLSKLVSAATNKVLTVENATVLEQASSWEYLETELMSSCAEARAEAERDLYVMQRCVFDTEGKNYWSSFDSIHDEIDIELVHLIQQELIRLRQGMPSAFEMVPPQQVEESIKNG